MTGSLSAEDQLAIRDCIARYAWALDTGDVEGFASCFASGGELFWDSFEEELRWTGTAALRHFAEFFRSLPSSAGRQHHVSNIVIEPVEGGARARSYCAVALRQGDGPHALHMMGWYEDHLLVEQGRWCIAQRVIRDWSGPVLRSFAGQAGVKEPRAIPAPLRGALHTGDQE